MSDYVLNRSQMESTIDRLNELRRAIAGNPVIVVNEARTSFGYLGDMGNLPAKLEDLWLKGSQPDFAFDTTKKTGAGWTGPYLEVSAIELASALGLDGWGNPLVYSASSFTDSLFGATALGKLSSLGPDLTVGGDADITIDFFQAEVVSRVQGFVKDSAGNEVPGVGVTVNYPANGQLATQLVQTDSTGYYSFADVPFGNRSITIDPRLVLAPDTTVVSGNNNQNVKFTVKNFASGTIGFTSLSLSYTVIPDAWFDQIRIGNTTVWDYPGDATRFGSLDTVTFGQQNVTGSGTVQEAVPIRPQSPVTDVADIMIGDAGKGGSLTIELNDFNTAETGNGGADQDLIGVSFEVTLKNALNQVVGIVVVQP
jgi:hypothetical protein